MEYLFIAKAAGFIAAALAMGIGSLAPAYGQGLIGSKGCENLGKYPESGKNIRNAMLLAMGIVETSAIYALLVSGGILYLTYITG